MRGAGGTAPAAEAFLMAVLELVTRDGQEKLETGNLYARTG